MNEIEMAAGVLAVLALPLVGVGPLLMRTLKLRVFAAMVVSCTVIVLALTRNPVAAAITLCVGVGLVVAHRRASRRA